MFFDKFRAGRAALALAFLVFGSLVGCGSDNGGGSAALPPSNGQAPPPPSTQSVGRDGKPKDSSAAEFDTARGGKVSK